MLCAIGLYEVALTVHILAVVVAFGVLFAYPLIDAQIRRAGPDALPGLHRLHLELATRLITPAMTVVLVAGLYLVADGPYALEATSGSARRSRSSSSCSGLRARS